MKISILTLFPEMFNGFTSTSIIKRALTNQSVEIEIINIRDFTKDKYGRVDNPPTGGGAGLIMQCQPIIDALKSCSSPEAHKVILSPVGRTFSQPIAHEFAKLEHLILICGHYEGIDSRVNNYVDESISIGDYVLTGGELGSMVISDAVIRLLDGAITGESIIEESFENGLLEYPQYTLPYNFEGHLIPDILFSGNHEAIAKWRKKKSIELTMKYRNDLFKNYSFNKIEKKLLEEIETNSTGKWETDAIEKGKKFIK